MFKKILITLVTFIALIVGAGFWFMNLLPESPDFAQLKKSVAKDIPYLQRTIPQTRGKILAVVTSTNKMGSTGKKTGYELTELSRAYWVFTVNGFEVDIASVQGGEPPVIIDNDDMKAFDYAFLNDEVAQYKVNYSLKVDEINPDDYQAVYFVGGKGAMFDFPDNIAIQNIAKQLYQNDKVVAAICHGPAALTNVQLDSGEYLVANKQLTSFTNDEELLLIPEAEEIFPFLLEDKLISRGAKFDGGYTYLNQTHRDNKLITGQNPWSIWTTAENIIQALGYAPLPREKSSEEYGVELLEIYEKSGFDSAVTEIEKSPNQHFGRVIVAMHSIVALMKFNVLDAIQLARLTSVLKDKAISDKE